MRHLAEPQRDTLYLIDVSIYIFKYYFSLPERRSKNAGRPIETLQAYAQWLINFLLDRKPSRLIACFDESLTSCFRNEIYPEYKSSRALPDDNLAFQLLACKKITEFMGVHTAASDRYEADDLIASYANLAKVDLISFCILSKDKDLSQIVDTPNAMMWDYPNGEILDRHLLQKKLGVETHKVADYLALVGDSIDDIPGVPGVGKKTATVLLENYESWNDIQDNLHEVETLPLRGAARIKDNLEEYQGQVDMAIQLTKTRDDISGLNLSDAAWAMPDVDSLVTMSEQLNLSQGFKNKVMLLREEYENCCG